MMINARERLPRLRVLDSSICPLFFLCSPPYSPPHPKQQPGPGVGRLGHQYGRHAGHLQGGDLPAVLIELHQLRGRGKWPAGAPDGRRSGGQHSAQQRAHRWSGSEHQSPAARAALQETIHLDVNHCRQRHKLNEVWGSPNAWNSCPNLSMGSSHVSHLLKGWAVPLVDGAPRASDALPQRARLPLRLGAHRVHPKQAGRDVGGLHLRHGPRHAKQRPLHDGGHRRELHPRQAPDGRPGTTASQGTTFTYLWAS